MGKKIDLKGINWFIVASFSLFAVVVLVVLLWPAKYPDIESWHQCHNDSECVASVNVMCAGVYHNIDDACINVAHVEKADNIPTGYTCKYGVTECYCSDQKCFAKR